MESPKSLVAAVRPEQLEARLATLGICGARLERCGVRRFIEAQRLEVVQADADGRQHRLTPETAAAWRRLRGAADNDGVVVFVVSAFRGIERQMKIIRRKLDAGQSLEAVLALNAPPGYSEHHSGRAVDVGTAAEPLLETSFADTPAFAWLQTRAGEFGFTLSYPENNDSGYRYEPWHWCYHAAQ